MAPYQRSSRSRKRRRQRLFWAGAVLLLLCAVGVTRCLPQNLLGLRGPGVAPNNLAAATLVVYNETDPLSRDLAQFYAEQRGIADDHVVSLTCPAQEEITRQQYDDTIAGPLRRIFDERHWWVRGTDKPGAEPSSDVSVNQIRFVALMRGMPLKIAQTTGYAGDFTNTPAPLREQNQASVDSEVAALGFFTRSISGPLPNPYFHSFRRIFEVNAPTLMLVTRLDAATGSTVKRMISEGIAAEKNGLWGRCYVDYRGLKQGEPMADGDEWIRHIAQIDSAPLRLPTVVDNRAALFPTAYPMTDAALYFGWYAQDVAGPFTRDDFHFQPGAIAFHLHSFSAYTLRDPTKYWVAPLLEKGAAASLGNVYEPFLGLTVHIDVFASRLFDGMTLAESAYAATPAVSWMNVVVGDPLYRPAQGWIDASFDTGLSHGPASEGAAYLQGAEMWRAQNAAAGAQALQKSGRALRSGMIFEGLAYLQALAGDSRAAHVSLDQAAHYYRDPADVARTVLIQARMLSDAGQVDKAVTLLRASHSQINNHSADAALDEMIDELAPPPPVSPSAPR